MKITKNISIYEKGLHWLMLLSFLGLCATALSAEFFFSKEAIMDSFKESLPMLHLEIAPADQFFMSRIARRDTWDIHLYFGFAFGSFTILWMLITLIRKNSVNALFKIVFFTSALTLTATGIYMWLRLYFHLSEEMFGLLKKIHYFGYWTFIYTLVVHIIYMVYMENKKEKNRKGALSNMVSLKNIAITLMLLATVSTEKGFAQSDLNRWANDNNYIEGVLYMEGEKGAEILRKEIANCPYDKCKLENVEDNEYGSKIFEFVKPDYKKSIELLSKSSKEGNPLASTKLLKFLVKRIDYKSKKPNGYLLKELKADTGLNYEEYKSLFNKTLEEGIETQKSCISEFLFAETRETGILKNDIDKNLAKEHYKKAVEVCPSNNLYKMLANGKLNRMKNQEKLN